MDTIHLHPVQPTLDARHFAALIELWLQAQTRRLAPKTAADYADKLRYFQDWWRTIGTTVEWQLTEELLLDFNAHLTQRISRFGRPLGYHTRKDCLRRLRQCLLWAYKKGHVSRNYSHWVPAPSGTAPMRTAAPLDQLRLLLTAADRSQQPTRDRAILAVLLGTGVRRSECASINVETIQFNLDNSGTLQVEAKKVKQRETHRRLVAFDAATGRHLRAHRDTRGATGPLFCVTQGAGAVAFQAQARLTPVSIYRVVKRLIRLAGLQDQLQGPHDLRRNFATYYNRNRRGEAHGQLLSKQLGHSSFRMTAGYSLQDVEDIREVIISPFALLEMGKR